MNSGIYRERLEGLRAWMHKNSLDAFMVPTTDEFLNEYVPESEKRLAWLTGFTGSNGFAFILNEGGVLFTDGRYLLQAEQQMQGLGLKVLDLSQAASWLKSWENDSARRLQVHHSPQIGYDPWLHAIYALQRWQERAPRSEFIAQSPNPIDTLWCRERPAARPIVVHDLAYAGQAHVDKIRALQSSLHDVDAVVVSVPEAIAWLLNIRGSDSATVPVPFARAVVFSAQEAAHRGHAVALWTSCDQLTEALLAHFQTLLPHSSGVQAVHVTQNGTALLASLRGKKVGLDPYSVPAAIQQTLAQQGADIQECDDLVALPKAIKNSTELSGMRACHVEDGAAVVRALCWLEAAGRAGERVTELDVVQRLFDERSQAELFRGVSFPTIAATGAHGAIIHYQPTPASNASLQPGDLVVIDSGGQYKNGTTDITRTVLFGGVPDPQRLELFRDRFTRVLKGHIAIAQSRFPLGTPGCDLDSLARWWLWQKGLDYAHGTGHGVGSYLNVHEGPQAISRGRAQDVSLQPGMILSNEPGYYKSASFGIRIESLVAVVPSSDPDDEHSMLAFETLTLAPIDRALIHLELLSDTERAWLDCYHERVYQTLSPRLSEKEARWLHAVTRPLNEQRPRGCAEWSARV